MNCYEIISTAIATISVIISGIAALFTYKNLKEIRNQFFEQNRGNLIFYIDKTKDGVTHSLILKNFGNSPAKLLSIQITPSLDWNKTSIGLTEEFNFSNCKNVFLAPNQHILSEFDFRNYPDKIFQITIDYETCGRTISETYSIDLHFSHVLISTNKQINNELSALKAINQSIQQLSNKFL